MDDDNKVPSLLGMCFCVFLPANGDNNVCVLLSFKTFRLLFLLKLHFM